MFRFARVLLDGTYPVLTTILVFAVMLGGNLYAAERAKRHAQSSVSRVVTAFDEYLDHMSA